MRADDYLVKPFQGDELMAHITAVFRRTEITQQTPEEAEETEKGRIVTLFSPKGGVGTTTLAIQLCEAIALREDRPVALIDLDLPLGGVAPMINLFTEHHVSDLLSHPHDDITPSLIKQYMQKHRTNLFVIPAPGQIIPSSIKHHILSLQVIMNELSESGYHVVLDLGSSLTKLTIAALRLSHLNYIVTSGQSLANKLLDMFMASAHEMGLTNNNLLPVINELHGTVPNLSLSRVPVARIPHANERSRTRLWLKDQGMRKLVSVMM